MLGWNQASVNSAKIRCNFTASCIHPRIIISTPVKEPSTDLPHTGSFRTCHVGTVRTNRGSAFRETSRSPWRGATAKPPARTSTTRAEQRRMAMEPAHQPPCSQQRTESAAAQFESTAETHNVCRRSRSHRHISMEPGQRAVRYRLSGSRAQDTKPSDQG